jgi:hypothetical protein
MATALHHESQTPRGDGGNWQVSRLPTGDMSLDTPAPGALGDRRKPGCRRIFAAVAKAPLKRPLAGQN